MRKALDCPHCFASVLVLDDNICPRCKRNTSVEPSLRKLRVTENESFPNNCLHCDQPTQRRTLVKCSTGENQGGTTRRLVGIILSYGHPLSLVWHLLKLKEASGSEVVMQFRLPQCEACRRRGRPRPLEIDFETNHACFLVDKAFYDRMRRSSDREPSIEG